EAELRLRPRIAARRRRNEFTNHARIITPGIGVGPTPKPISEGGSHGRRAHQENGKQCGRQASLVHTQPRPISKSIASGAKVLPDYISEGLGRAVHWQYSN